MHHRLISSANGAVVELGHQIGSGGEAAVFDVVGQPALVAKVYKNVPNSRHQDKLAFMTANGDGSLLDYAAWPQLTLREKAGGPIVGFLMPKVRDRSLIFKLYIPAYRRKELPKAAWSFLLHVARNCAASFEVIHRHGHVVADVNQSNLMFAADSTVTLIDCDSFQISGNGTVWTCPVGVGHFTPPELQNLKSFDGYTRTPNHDAFGLAVLIFHLLFCGRHPFAGVPKASGVGDTLEDNIRQFRYAYARDNDRRLIGPPPNAASPSIVPDDIEAMFHHAFTEAGARGSRPTAKQWEVALDRLRRALVTCKAAPSHLYSSHLSRCPWCLLEAQGAYYFVDLGTTVNFTPSGFVLTQAWAAIEAVQPPPAPMIPSLDLSKFVAKPLPAGLVSDTKIALARGACVAIAILVTVASNGALWWIAGIGALWGWNWASSIGAEQRSAERRRRAAARDSAKEVYERVVERARRDSSPARFHTRLEQLTSMKTEYSRSEQLLAEELAKLHSTAEARQKQKFLESFLIEDANIPTIGAGRKATLRSFGIETAADINRSRIMQVRGFKHALASALVTWRAGCESRFRFNSALAVTDADRSALRAKYAARRAAIEKELALAPAELSRIRQEAIASYQMIATTLQTAALDFAQAEKDLTVI